MARRVSQTVADLGRVLRLPTDSRANREHGAVVVGAAVGGGAVEIAECVEDDGRVRKASVGAVAGAEAVKHGFCPAGAGGRHFEHGAGPGGAAVGGGAVKISGGVEDQSGVRIFSVRTTGEIMQNFLGLGCGPDLEDGAVTMKAAEVCGAVQVAGVIHG